ncbi:MAG: hypothetical protein ABIR32_11950 [Ilumatobacteraceae bacterium]
MSAPINHRHTAGAFLVGAAGTTLAGALVQTLLIPTTDVADDRWSYPWETGPYVVVSLLYAVLHLFVVAGLVAFGRSGVAGTSPAARRGLTIAIVGTLTLTGGEIIGLPIGDAFIDDTNAQVVGAVFGLGVLLSAVGLLMVGIAALRAQVMHGWRRYTPLAAGTWTSLLVVLPLAIPKALPGCVAVYGVCLLGMAAALHLESRAVGLRSSQQAV